MKIPTIWDDQENVELLKTEVAKGSSSGMIAVMLSARLHKLVTRNAIAGKRDRLGLVPPGGVVRERLPRAKRPRKKPQRLGIMFYPFRPAPVPPTTPVPPATPQARKKKPVGFFKLQGSSCRWPIGRENFLYCGNPRCESKPYCLEHCSMAYVRWRRRSNPYTTLRV